MLRLFISDLHLEEARPDILRAFFQFLQDDAATADELYILGDFFEVWIGDDDLRPLAVDVAEKLKTCAAGGTDIFIMQGNRDFLLGEAFCQRADAALLNDPSVITLAGAPCLLMHGDSLCTQDTSYMAFRQESRSSTWQNSVLSLPLEERRALARQLRMASTEANSNKAEDIMDVTPAEVVRELKAHQCLRLIHGHTHRPARHTLSVDDQPAERIVLGDWDSAIWWLRADDHELSLLNRPL